jgi:electron transport complex protein RnfB
LTPRCRRRNAPAAAILTGRPAQPLNPVNGVEATRRVAVIDEAWCIGCTLCIKACPVDCIVGAPKAMHVVVAAQCTGCELCVPACPVDCISMPEVTTTTGWAAWSQPQAGTHPAASAITDPAQLTVKRAVIEAALARARAKRASEGG